MVDRRDLGTSRARTARHTLSPRTFVTRLTKLPDRIQFSFLSSPKNLTNPRLLDVFSSCTIKWYIVVERFAFGDQRITISRVEVQKSVLVYCGPTINDSYKSLIIVVL